MLTERQKQAQKEAQKQWNEQCKNFIHGKQFRDRTAKHCFDRVYKEMFGQEAMKEGQ